MNLDGSLIGGRNWVLSEFNVDYAIMTVSVINVYHLCFSMNIALHVLSIVFKIKVMIIINWYNNDESQ